MGARGIISSRGLITLLIAGTLGPVSNSSAAIEDYVLDRQGKVIHTLYGECIHLTSWSPDKSIPGCDGVPLEGDADSDGVVDSMDKCPGTPKGVKVDSLGCPIDSDADGVADHKDKCPGTPKGVTVDSAGCPLDSDRDGVANYKDNCPNTPSGVSVDGNGCPLDTDGDSVADYKDECPNTKAGAKVDNRGCELKARIELRGVTFANNSAKLTGDSAEVLTDMAITLKRYPDLKVEVAGHTDGSGTRAYNLQLSERRANAVRDYLIGQGVDGDNLTAKGYGPDHPLVSNSTREGRAKNRRVELVLQK